MRSAPLAIPSIIHASFVRCFPHQTSTLQAALHLSYTFPAGWRCYKYTADERSAQAFGPHYDGSQPATTVEDGELVVDGGNCAGGRTRSQMSLLLYLSGGHDGGNDDSRRSPLLSPHAPLAAQGASVLFRSHHPGLTHLPSPAAPSATGETIFHPSGEALPDSAVRVAPRAGSALLFWHGEHPLSPLHEGAPLTLSDVCISTNLPAKYVIRTDVLFTAEQPPAWNGSGGWESSNYVQAMRFAMAAER